LVENAGMLTVPLIGCVGLFVVGAGPASLLSRRFAPDVRAALILPIGAAFYVAASTIVVLGAPFRAVVALLVSLGAATAIARHRALRAVGSEALLPALVAAAALSISSIPAFASGTWDASTPGNADPYYWVSEARAFISEPAPTPAENFPDRAPYELVTEQQGTFGIAFGLGALALGARTDPVRIYSAFASLIGTILALVVYAMARAVGAWPRSRSALVAALISANGYLLFATFYGWQAQLLLTAFGLLALLSASTALGGMESGRDSELLAALAIAAGVCSYGATFTPFIGLLVLVFASHRIGVSSQTSRLLMIAARISALTVIVAAVPIARSIARTSELIRHATSTLPHDPGLPAEAVGLVPRLTEYSRGPIAWTIAATVVSTILLLTGAVAAARIGKATDVLVWTSTAAILGIVVLASTSRQYVSMKFTGYTAPLLVLTMVTPNIRRRQRLVQFGRALTIVVAALLFAATSTVVEYRAIRFNLHAAELSGLEAAGRSLSPDARVAISLRDAWSQAWAIYFLRNQPVSLTDDLGFAEKFGINFDRRGLAKAQFIVSRQPSGRVVWAHDGITLSVRR
jgi:hypothetical protein